jgi:CspA family cold shock protein
MQRGTIKKLVSDKGFGFIAGDEKGKDLFFHLSCLQDAAFESLYEGQTVDYESEMGPKGMRASVVKPATA